MGTRSTTKIKDENGRVLVSLYRQYDGYPSGHGVEVANFLNARKVVNGFGGNQTGATHANGMGCLGAQLVSHLKGDQIGNVYLTSADDSQEYNYTIYLKEGALCMRVESEYNGLLFDGKASEFDAPTVEANEARLGE